MPEVFRLGNDAAVAFAGEVLQKPGGQGQLIVHPAGYFMQKDDGTGAEAARDQGERTGRAKAEGVEAARTPEHQIQPAARKRWM